MTDNLPAFVPGSRNLPAAIRRQGGALAEVLGTRFPELTHEQQLQIAMVVEAFPQLNSTHAVDVLAWSAFFHNLRLNEWFAELVERCGLARVHLAVECMYDLGISDEAFLHLGEEGGVSTRSDQGNLEDVLDFIKRLDELGHCPANPTDFGDRVFCLGGWSEREAHSEEVMVQLLAGERQYSELRLPNEEPTGLAEAVMVVDEYEGERDEEGTPLRHKPAKTANVRDRDWSSGYDAEDEDPDFRRVPDDAACYDELDED